VAALYVVNLNGSDGFGMDECISGIYIGHFSFTAGDNLDRHSDTCRSYFGRPRIATLEKISSRAGIMGTNATRDPSAGLPYLYASKKLSKAPFKS
jgi:hypothetical protein